MNRMSPHETESAAGTGGLPPAAFAAEVRSWVFDLDNTLYPPGSTVFDQIDRRMTAYIGRILGLEPAQAFALQKSYYRRYGTSLCGLMTEHGIDPEPFLAYVHDIDHSVIPADPDLVAALKALPGRRFVYTNGSAEHAKATLARIGANDVFDAIFDIRAARFTPKPQEASYRRMIETLGIAPQSSVFVEDSLKNLPPAAALGMKTVWLRNQRTTAGTDLYDPAACDAVIEDLTAWLRAVADAG